MPVCKLSKTDFFIFSSANGGSSSPYAQVPIGNQFLQCETFPKVLRYFQNILLPEIMTRKQEPDFENCRKFYCYSQRPSFGQMIGCDKSNFEKEWFHYKCVGLKRGPKRKWFYSREREKRKNVGGSKQTRFFSKILFIDILHVRYNYIYIDVYIYIYIYIYICAILNQAMESL